MLQGLGLRVDRDMTRPTTALVKEALFEILRPELEGAYFLDLFAGTGQIGLEALSRGAKSVIAVEKDASVARALEQVTRERLLPLRIYPMDLEVALARLSQQQKKVDLVYADPPYAWWCEEKMLGLLQMLEPIATGLCLFEMDRKALWIGPHQPKKGKAAHQRVLEAWQERLTMHQLDWRVERLYTYGDTALIKFARPQE